jgi:multidrug resistance efflux pump
MTMDQQVSPDMDAPSDKKVENRPAAARKPIAWAVAASRVFAAIPVSTAIRVFILILIGALVLVVAREWNWWVGAATLQSTDDAYLEADTTPLAAKVPGYVKRVPVQDFQRVHGGDVLVEIVDDDYRAQLDQAEANVAAAGAAI